MHNATTYNAPNADDANTNRRAGDVAWLPRHLLKSTFLFFKKIHLFFYIVTLLTTFK